jgi:hypothetical protein
MLFIDLLSLKNASVERATGQRSRRTALRRDFCGSVDAVNSGPEQPLHQQWIWILFMIFPGEDSTMQRWKERQIEAR